VKDSKTHQGMAHLCHFQARLEVRTKIAIGRRHSCPSRKPAKESTCGAGNGDELAQLI
jgi:hypothetical protein